MATQEFNLPDPGEGLTEADIVTWHVAVGDTVKVNDIIVEIETAKSLVELPVPFAGTVTALLVDEGATVEVGTPIIAVDDGVGGGSPAPSTGGGAGAEGGAVGAEGDGGEEQIEEGKIGGTTATGRTAVLVGYGVKQTEAKRRPRKGSASAPVARSAAVPAASVASVSAAPPPAPQPASQARPLAKPPVRKFAKDNGIDLALVAPTGPGGVVTRADVESYAASSPVSAGSPSVVTRGGPDVTHSNGAGALSGARAAYGMGFAGGEREQRVPIKGVRKMTAQAMVGSAFTAPHVTEWITVDVTATMDLVANLKRDREFRDVKVTPLLILAKAMIIAARRNPQINAAWDEQAQEIVLKGYVNLGIAAATPRGLVVPNVKDADRLTLRELAEAIGALTDTAREGRTQPADMAGGTITITNVGVFGVDAGTPILNPGEAAILAFGAVNRRPWVVTAADGSETIEPRSVTTLALSFDHRLVDGELGSRYLADVAAILADPGRALVWA